MGEEAKRWVSSTVQDLQPSRAELYRLLVSGHGRAAKYILERGADEYADVIVKAMRTTNPSTIETYSRYWVRFAECMDQPAAMVEPLLETLSGRMPNWRRRRMLKIAIRFAKVGFRDFDEILNQPRSKRILNYEDEKSKPEKPITCVEDVVENARSRKSVFANVLRAWPAKDKVRLIKLAFEEEEEESRGFLLRAVYYLRALPRDFRPLLQWAESNNAELRHWSAILLSLISHADVRSLALRLSTGGHNKLRYAGELIEANILPGDAPMLREWYLRASGIDMRHSMTLTLRTIEKEHRNGEWDWVLPLIYNETECFECREFVVRDMIKSRTFRTDWAEEGLFDASGYTVQDCRAYLRRRKRDITELLRLADV